MPVDEPRDVLEALMALATHYKGPKPWVRVFATTSNPIKIRSNALKPVIVHSEPRQHLSAREACALIFALHVQGVGWVAGQSFSRVFTYEDGRELMLENGVVRDLLAVGAISPSGVEHNYVLTGMGAERLAAYFPELLTNG